ncbi:MAG: ABC transporter ATP-binding protein, partial [bacterium]|nr:ABC transporter ATP-binding protein [bacterium]
MASIRLEGIHKNFPGVQALVDITQEIESGEFFTLLGPSGCGKTTLLRTVAGFYQQDSGHIHIADREIDNVPA